MQVPLCEYRVELAAETFFCRHARIHAYENLVDPVICSNCDQRNEPCHPRPLPTDPIYSEIAKARERRWEFISAEQLIADTRRLIGRLPDDLAGVAGLPRSGMLPASFLATLLHLPLYEVNNDGLRPLGHGLRLNGRSQSGGTILVIDDSVYGGVANRSARTALGRHGDVKFLFAALYPRPQLARCVDLYARLVPDPHLFEWNLFNCNQTRNFAFDCDGIFCEDWPGGDEDGDAYEEFLAEARPRWLPRRSPVPLVVTARLEKHRPATESWLKRHGIEVGRLIMGPWSSASERRKHYRAGEFKGQAYAESKCSLFIESDHRQAAEIFSMTGRPVLCPSTGSIFQ